MKHDDADIIADERMLTCGRCKKSVSISKIQYLPRGDGSVIALCSNCREQKSVKTEIKPKPKIPSASQKINYLCTRCNYKFSFDPSGNANLKCPYCSKADKLKDTSAHSAERIIDSPDF